MAYFAIIGKARVMLYIGAGYSNNCHQDIISKTVQIQHILQ